MFFTDYKTHIPSSPPELKKTPPEDTMLEIWAPDLSHRVLQGMIVRPKGYSTPRWRIYQLYGRNWYYLYRGWQPNNWRLLDGARGEDRKLSETPGERNEGGNTQTPLYWPAGSPGRDSVDTGLAMAENARAKSPR